MDSGNYLKEVRLSEGKFLAKKRRTRTIIVIVVVIIVSIILGVSIWYMVKGGKPSCEGKGGISRLVCSVFGGENTKSVGDIDGGNDSITNILEVSDEYGRKINYEVIGYEYQKLLSEVNGKTLVWYFQREDLKKFLSNFRPSGDDGVNKNDRRIKIANKSSIPDYKVFLTH